MALRHLYEILQYCAKQNGTDDFEDYHLPVAEILAISDDWHLAPDDPKDKNHGCSDSKHWNDTLDKHGPGTLEYEGKLYVLAGDWKYPIFWWFEKVPKVSLRYGRAVDVLKYLESWKHSMKVEPLRLRQKLFELEAEMVEFDGEWQITATCTDEGFDTGLDTEPEMAYGEEVLQVRGMGGIVTIAWVKGGQ